MGRLILISLILFAAHQLHGQADSVYFDRDILITESRLRLSETGSVQVAWHSDSLSSLQALDLSRLLMRNETVYIKSYGPGILSTSSIRGGQAGHALVLWNGLPVQSPLVGQLDFSLIPLLGIERVRLTKGGHSSSWGSGAIGGVLSLEDAPPKTNSAEFSFAAGSFGLREFHTSIYNRKGPLQSASHYSYLGADNDFPFQAGTRTDTLENATVRRHVLKQDFYLVPGPSTELAFHYWGILADRKIPPSLNQVSSTAGQKDDIHRMSLQLRHATDRGYVIARVGMFSEQLDYRDPRISLYSRTGFRSLIADMSYEANLSSEYRILAGATIIKNLVNPSPNYPSGSGETRSGIFVSLVREINGFVLQGNLRQELLGGEFLLPIPSVALDWKPSEQWSIQAKLGRNFRFPSLNDRFWIPGGNSGLKPESGWSSEAGISWELPGKSRCSISGFNRIIHHWILWTPDERTGLWSPSNLHEVWSRGVEIRAETTLKLQGIQFRLKLGYDYIRSTNQQGLSSPRIEKGSQLWYTPEQVFLGDLEMNWKGLKISYTHRYNGPTQGINAGISSWHLGELNIARRFSHTHSSIEGFISLSNAWSEQYTMVEFRPMPGRNARAGIHLILKEKNP